MLTCLSLNIAVGENNPNTWLLRNADELTKRAVRKLPLLTLFGSSGRIITIVVIIWPKLKWQWRWTYQRRTWNMTSNCEIRWRPPTRTATTIPTDCRVISLAVGGLTITQRCERDTKHHHYHRSQDGLLRQVVFFYIFIDGDDHEKEA